MQNYDCVGVLGGGSWGTTLAHLLGQNGHKVLLWLKDPKVAEEIKQSRRNRKYTNDFELSEKIRPTLELEEVAKRCEIIIVAIPSQSFREVVYRLGNHVKGDQILISACKGLEAGTHSLMSTILTEETCVKKIGVLSGPNLFQEILNGSPSATVIGSRYTEIIKKGIQIFASNHFKVYGSDDIVGVELGGVVKNVVAIAAGIADGMEYGDNTKSLLITRGMSEMGRIGSQMGARPITFTGLAGIGDMMVSCSSQLSRNYRVGYNLARGKSLSQIMKEMYSVAEGINTAKVLHELAQEKKFKTPIMEGVYQILYQNRNIQEVVVDLMNRMALFEIDMTLFS